MVVLFVVFLVFLHFIIAVEQDKQVRELVLTRKGVISQKGVMRTAEAEETQTRGGSCCQ